MLWAPQASHSRPFVQGKCPLGCSSDLGEKVKLSLVNPTPTSMHWGPQNQLHGEGLGPQGPEWRVGATGCRVGRDWRHSPQGPWVFQSPLSYGFS